MEECDGAIYGKVCCKNVNMNLYILGNGFDMAHGLNTSYSAFEEYVKEYHKDWYQLLGTMYSMKDPSWLWKDYERNLCNVDITGVTTNYNSRWIGMKKHEIENFFDNIYDQLQSLFHEWILSVDMSNCSKKMNLSAHDFMLYKNVIRKIVEKEGYPEWCEDENDYVGFLMKCFQQLIGSLKKLPNEIIKYNHYFFYQLSRLPIEQGVCAGAFIGKG